MLLLLPHLQARQVGVPQHELVFVLEVLGHGALDGLAVLLLQREAEGQQRAEGQRGRAGRCSGLWSGWRCDKAPYVWWLAGRRVTLHTRYLRFIWPQWVISTFKPEPGENTC